MFIQLALGVICKYHCEHCGTMLTIMLMIVVYKTQHWFTRPGARPSVVPGDGKARRRGADCFTSVF